MKKVIMILVCMFALVSLVACKESVPSIELSLKSGNYDNHALNNDGYLYAYDENYVSYVINVEENKIDTTNLYSGVKVIVKYKEIKEIESSYSSSKKSNYIVALSIELKDGTAHDFIGDTNKYKYCSISNRDNIVVTDIIKSELWAKILSAPYIKVGSTYSVRTSFKLSTKKIAESNNKIIEFYFVNFYQESSGKLQLIFEYEDVKYRILDKSFNIQYLFNYLSYGINTGVLPEKSINSLELIPELSQIASQNIVKITAVERTGGFGDEFYTMRYEIINSKQIESLKAEFLDMECPLDLTKTTGDMTYFIMVFITDKGESIEIHLDSKDYRHDNVYYKIPLDFQKYFNDSTMTEKNHGL